MAIVWPAPSSSSSNSKIWFGYSAIFYLFGRCMANNWDILTSIAASDTAWNGFLSLLDSSKASQFAHQMI